MSVKITADSISLLLQQKHSADICVPECKTGSTVFSHFRTLDLWVMPRSWAHMNIIGYEIKVDRQDFLHDEKWQEYLPYCNSFYFACPPGVIAPEELPAEVGLLVTSTHGKMLLKKRKAVRRDVHIPESIYQYILMSRTRIIKERSDGAQGVAFWQEWLKEKQINSRLGWAVGKALREEIETRVEKADQTNTVLQRQIERLEDVKKTLIELGLDAGVSSWDVRRMARESAKLVPVELRRSITIVQAELKRFEDALNGLERGNTQQSA